MKHRAPSSAVAPAGTNSNVRRRSGGATTFNRHTNANDDSFPSSYSQPSISVVSGEESTRSQLLHTLSIGPSHKNSGRSSDGRVRDDIGGYRSYSGVSKDVASGESPSGSLVPSRQPSSANSDIVADFLDNPAFSSDSSPPSAFPQPPSMNHFPRVGLDSNAEFQLSGTTYLGVSVDSGHGGFIRALRTTDKFTKKWPAPRNFKDPELRHKLGTVAAPSLEEGQGLDLTVAKWTVFKWCLLLSVVTVLAAGCAGLIIAIMTWSNTWQNSQVMVVADYDILIFITLSGASLLFTGMFGIVGTLLNSRPILAIYALLLWPSTLSVLAVGYSSYRHASFSLDQKLSFSWSRFYTPLGRRIIQDSLLCCGFFSSMHEISPSSRCYLRTPLPGCRAKLFKFERDNLRAVWRAAFSLALLHLINIVISLLCSNHITKTFGKGITPRQYRLTPEDVKADAEKFLNRNGAKNSGTTVLEEVGAVHEKDVITEKP